MTQADLTRAPWRKSTYSSQDGNCVEVSSGRPARIVAIRDTQNRDGFTLRVPSAEWRRLTASVK